MSESSVERRCRIMAKSENGALLKFLPWLMTGFPDRILAMPGGWVVFMEFKAPDKGLRPKQQYWRDWLVSRGFNYAVIRTVEEFEEWLYPPESEDPRDMGWVNDRGLP